MGSSSFVYRLPNNHIDLTVWRIAHHPLCFPNCDLFLGMQKTRVGDYEDAKAQRALIACVLEPVTVEGEQKWQSTR
jgi:hypothetical protein